MRYASNPLYQHQPNKYLGKISVNQIYVHRSSRTCNGQCFGDPCQSFSSSISIDLILVSRINASRVIDADFYCTGLGLEMLILTSHRRRHCQFKHRTYWAVAVWKNLFKALGQRRRQNRAYMIVCRHMKRYAKINLHQTVRPLATLI